MYLCVGNPIHVYWDAEATQTQPVLPIWQLCGCGSLIAHSVHSGTHPHSCQMPHSHRAITCITPGRVWLARGWTGAACIPVLASNCYLLRLAVSQTEPLCPNMTSVWVAGMSPQTHPVCVWGPAPTRCMDMVVTLGDSSCVRVATCPNRQQ